MPRKISDSTIDEIISHGKSMLGKSGKIIVRKSGTEPILRVAIQHKTPELIDKVLKNIVEKYALD
jgi:phosphoglucosamine mutase